MSFKAESSLTWNGNEAKIAGRNTVALSAYDTGIVIEGQAAALCQVDTGRLRGSISVQSAKRSHVIDPGKAMATDIIQRPSHGDTVYVGTNCFYGPYIEYGTVRSGAQPFMRPSLDLAKGRVVTLIRKNKKVYFKDYLK
jgi:hypothetical protein